MNDTVSSMNGTLWIFAALLIGMVLIQTSIFVRMALKFNKKNKVVTDAEIKSAIKAGSVSVIGPAISGSIVALSLIVLVGSAVTYMRCGVIGAPAWELFMAGIAVQAAGAEFGTDSFTPAIFVLAIFGMTFASAPYFLNTIITLKPLDKAVEKARSKKNEITFIPYLANAAMMGLIGYSIFGYLSSPASVACLISSCLVSYAVISYVAKSGKRGLADWNMIISMAIGMGVGQIVSTLIG